MADIITVAIIAVVIAAAVTYIVKEKKKGTRCIGCPSAGTCASKNSGGCQSDCGGQ